MYRKPNESNRYDTCTNWEKLDAWASERSFSMFDQKSLVHPKYGEVPMIIEEESWKTKILTRISGLSFPMVNGTIERTPVGPGMSIIWPKDD